MSDCVEIAASFGFNINLPVAAVIDLRWVLVSAELVC